MKSKLLRALPLALAASSLVPAAQSVANPFGTVPPAPIPVDSCGGTANDQFRIPYVEGWGYDRNGGQLLQSDGPYAISTNGESSVKLDVYDTTVLPKQYVTSYTMDFPNNAPCSVGPNAVRVDVGQCEPAIPGLRPSGTLVTAWFTNNTGAVMPRLSAEVVPVVPSIDTFRKTADNIPPGAPFPITFERLHGPGLQQAGTYDMEYLDANDKVTNRVRFTVPYVPFCTNGYLEGDPLYDGKPSKPKAVIKKIKGGDTIRVYALNQGVMKKTQFRVLFKSGNRVTTTLITAKPDSQARRDFRVAKPGLYVVEAKFAKAGKKATWRQVAKLRV